MNITRTTTTTLQDILKDERDDRVAMFRVESMSISCDAEDWILGEHVYVKDGKIYDFMSDTEHGMVEGFDLHFVAYIGR
jgi:hypothetical protein